jgi:hypothetical protein
MADHHFWCNMRKLEKKHSTLVSKSGKGPGAISGISKLLSVLYSQQGPQGGPRPIDPDIGIMIKIPKPI